MEKNSIIKNSLNAFMAKLLNSKGEKILLGTVLYNGDTTSNFTLNDDYINYDYIEVVWRPHPTLGQCSDTMIPSKDSKLHLERTQSINGVTTVYRCQMTFSGRNVTLTGRTQVINGASVDAVEEHILRVIGY